MKEGKLLAPLTFEGSCNKDLFEAWLKNCLLPLLEPGDIIIIDNASFHKADATPRLRKAQGNAHQAGESIKELVEGVGCEIWYLPPYSPDMNKIENWWAVLKTWMKQRKLGGVGFRPAKVFKKRLKDFQSVRECVDAAFRNCPNVCA